MEHISKSSVYGVFSEEDTCEKEPFETPQVSIIVPAYNTEKYISKCIYHLVNQTLECIEIIVVDDGSTDGTLSIVQKFADKDKRIKIITQENQRQGAARNNGMMLAKGEYIGFIDSDDWIDLDYFEKLYNAAIKYNADIALAANVRIGNGKTKKRLEIQKEEFVTSLQDKIDISNQVKNPCPTNKIYRKKLLTENTINWTEGAYCEDKLFTMQALYYANGLVTVPNVNYYYFRNPDSTVNSKKKRFAGLSGAKEKAKKSVLNFLKEKNVQIRDKEFWAVKKEIRLCGFPLFLIKESLHTERFYLFSLIKVGEKTNG